MSAEVAVSYMAFLSILWQDAIVSSSKVEQFPIVLHEAVGGNVSMFCKYHILQVIPDVYWWRESENAFIGPDSRKQFHINKASGSFTLLNLSVADSGKYYCYIKQQQQPIGNGSGTLLSVFAPPTPLKIIPVKGTSSQSRKLVCKTARFYPEKIEISWRRNNEEILIGIETVKNRSSDGLYEVSSFLDEIKLAWGDAVYTCLVSHVSLEVPTALSYIVKTDADKNLIIGCAVGVLAILVLASILIRLQVKAQND